MSHRERIQSKFLPLFLCIFYIYIFFAGNNFTPGHAAPFRAKTEVIYLQGKDRLMERVQTTRSFIAEGVAERDSSANPSKASASIHSNEGGGYSLPSTRMATNKNKSRIVPRSKRRGMFAQLALVPEIEDPRDYGKFIKYLITTLIGAAGSTAPMASTILFRMFVSSLGACTWV